MDVSIDTAVRKFVADNYMYREGLTSLQDSDSLLDKGLIDSTGVLELVFFLEKSFGVKVNDDEVLPENLDSIQRISRFVQMKLQPQAQAYVA